MADRRRGAALALLLLLAAPARAGLVITGVVDGPRAGGSPKAVELYATSDIADLSFYGLDLAANGAGFSGADFALFGSAAAGQFLWVSAETTEFLAYFGFPPTFTSAVANVNGNDAFALWAGGVVVDVFGDPSQVAGASDFGAPWAYRDSFAGRAPGSPASAVFIPSAWTFGGNDALDPQGPAGVNGDDGVIVPFGQARSVPEPGGLALAFLGAGVLLLYVRRRVRSTAMATPARTTAPPRYSRPRIEKANAAGNSVASRRL